MRLRRTEGKRNPLHFARVASDVCGTRVRRVPSGGVFEGVLGALGRGTHLRSWHMTRSCKQGGRHLRAAGCGGQRQSVRVAHVERYPQRLLCVGTWVRVGEWVLRRVFGCSFRCLGRERTLAHDAKLRARATPTSRMGRREEGSGPHTWSPIPHAV